ncbi:hypothetical protein B0H13DRAFT_2234445 [Mycena leptocephala]|nr:hypothetical protein B0H13DRAFT_2234445 [Mycena leptocephala]
MSPTKPKTSVSIDLLDIYHTLFERSFLTPGRANHILHERCPACFGLEEWGQPLEDGGNVQLGAGGCFSYHHSRKAGDRLISYDPLYFLSKEKVDAVDAHIAALKKKKPAACKAKLLAEVLEACEASWDTANEKKQKADPKCHDTILFLCNINTPGEQQKYIMALLEETNSLLPPQATMVQAYDISCVTDRSFYLYPILSEDLHPRMMFVINTMHSYGHQWVCQLVYSPASATGCLTDGEGVKRFWSRIRKLIPITHHQWVRS